MARAAAPLLAITVLASACGNADGDADLAQADTAATVVATAASSTTTSSTTTSTTYGARLYGTDVDALAFAIEGVDALDSPVASTAAVTTTVAASSSGGAPQSPSQPVAVGAVTTTGGPGPSDEVAAYRGVLGVLDPNEQVAPPVVAPPAAVPGHLPLTGLPGDVPNRPAAVVKIDNGGPARPQTGLDVADIVVEEEVEGGITRFAAVFHSTSTVVGPVRSGRTTDIGVLAGLGTPLLMYSGANRLTDTLLRNQQQVQNRSFETSSGYWRASGRRAPSNLYTDTGPHWASAGGGSPAPWFAYRAAGAEPSMGSPVGGFAVSFRRNAVRWAWNGSAWARSQGGSPHTVPSGGQILAVNVVVVETRKVDTGMVDSSGASVPEFVFVGTGPATVFTGGRQISGVWTKPTLASVPTFTTADGTVIELAPGRTWIEMIEAGAGMLSIG